MNTSMMASIKELEIEINRGCQAFFLRTQDHSEAKRAGWRYKNPTSDRNLSLV